MDKNSCPLKRRNSFEVVEPSMPIDYRGTISQVWHPLAMFLVHWQKLYAK